MDTNGHMSLYEDYVSFETAKLLKEKGFYVPDYYCSRVYNEKGTLQGVNTVRIEGVKYICAPTLQMAMKFLREEHGIHCIVDYDFVLGWYCQITSLKETVEYDYEEMKHYHPDNDHGFASAEEACEAAIKYCLEKLI